MTVAENSVLAPDEAQALEQLLTVQDWLRWSVSVMNRSDIFFGHGSDSAIDENMQLMAFVLNLPWFEVEQWLSARLTLSEREHFLALLKQRILQRQPVAYITQEAWFCGMSFKVDERVLIPRSPIAEMIEQNFQPWLGDKQVLRAMDLCAGSGCIGLAMAQAFPQAQVELLDISFDTLAVAEENIERHQCQDRVMALQSDLFSAADGKYDLIISNPPYVDADDMACLPQEYLVEPELALAAGDDGLDLVRIMLRQARQYLNDGGVLVVEVGNSWPALEQAYPQVEFVWQEFERGGHGVFVLTAEQLDQYQAQF